MRVGFGLPNTRCLQEIFRPECFVACSNGEEPAQVKTSFFFFYTLFKCPIKKGDVRRERRDRQEKKKKKKESSGKKGGEKANKEIGCESWLCNRSFVRQISLSCVIMA